MSFNDDLAGLLQRSPPDIAELTEIVVEMLRRLRPELEARVKLGWGSVNFRHAQAGHVCAVFPMPEDVSLIFEWGCELSSPLLQGDGKVKRVRWIPFRPGEPLPEDEVGLLLVEAIALRA